MQCVINNIILIFQEEIEALFHKYITMNEESSVSRCKKLLGQLGGDLTKKLQNGSFLKSGGFAEFQEEVTKVQKLYSDYAKNTNLGVKVSFFLYISTASTFSTYQ